ncbi:MAG TPA: HAMP domain-containing sensor histidine kinase [Vicinamibacteria bacterium]
MPANLAMNERPASEPVFSIRADRGDISLEWLIRLRWGAVVGQLATIAVAQALFGGLRLPRLLVLVAVLALSNAALVVGRGRLGAPSRLCGAALTLDTLVLTGLLHTSGGPSNPFSVLYLVHIALAAVVLGARWTWFLAGLSVGCYGLLFIANVAAGHGGHGDGALGTHLQGMWVAFTMAAVLTAYFVVKLSTALEQRDLAMAQMRERVARQERLAAVTTLAAGAAHELGSPLNTIAVASRELERSIRALPDVHARALVEDASLIRSELERCRAILNRLAAESGQRRGEAPEEVDLPQVVADIVRGLPPLHQDRLRVEPGSGRSLSVSRGALVQVAQSLLQNAFEAGEGTVTLKVESSSSMLLVRVEDEGRGMSPDLLARVGEPFFSTKPPGQGLGLGLFIAKSLAEQMGGRLHIESRPGKGTTATVQVAAGPAGGSALGG